MQQRRAILLATDEKHWYQIEGSDTWLPSVSEILGSLKDGLEYVSPYDLRIASDLGIKVHAGCDLLEAGMELRKGAYGYREYEMLGGFVAWHSEPCATAKVILNETPLADKKLGFGGTPDRLYAAAGKNILVDFKTTSAIYDKHWLQVAAYAYLADRAGYKVDATAILRLTDKTKKRFQYEVHNEWRDDFKVFKNILKIYKHFNPHSKPKISDLPETLKL